jgi:hypothetical protein
VSYLIGARPETVEGVTWDRFLHGLRHGSRTPVIRAWDPGDHLAGVGPTGEGKTTAALGMLGLRKWVLALDPKGEDTTLSQSGYERIRAVPPPRRVQQDLAEGKPVHLIVGGAARTEREDRALSSLMQDALDYARRSGGWTVYADEFQLLGDQRLPYRLGPRIERMLIAARKDATSIVTSFQALAWVPRAAVRQATCGVALFPTRDRDMIQATARGMGRDWQQVAQIMDRMPRFHFLWIPRSVHDPLIMTSANEIKGGTNGGGRK